jgi:hypothetical protein
VGQKITNRYQIRHTILTFFVVVIKKNTCASTMRLKKNGFCLRKEDGFAP